MSNLLNALLVAFPALLLPGVPDPTADLLKCGARPGGSEGMPDAVMIIEEEVIGGDEVDRLDWNTLVAEYEIESLEVVCWDWVELHYGAQVRLGASYIRTKEQVERERTNGIAALEGLIAAQDRYRERHGVYALNPEALTDFTLFGYGLPVYFEVEFDAVAEGWAARLVAPMRTPRWGARPPTACRVFVGSAPEEWRSEVMGPIPRSRVRSDGPDEQPPLQERQPVCDF